MARTEHDDTPIRHAIHVVIWIARQPQLPDWQKIADHFDVSRVTAQRWLKAYCEARS